MWCLRENDENQTQISFVFIISAIGHPINMDEVKKKKFNRMSVSSRNVYEECPPSFSLREMSKPDFQKDLQSFKIGALV